MEQARKEADISRYVGQVVAGENGERQIPVALELVRGDLKMSHHTGHRTPWQILAAFAESGDCDALARCQEWERETKGVEAIRWRKGLREWVGGEERNGDGGGT